MIVATKGIVLKSVKYGETSLITTIYTEQYGLLSFIINGVRASKAKNKAALFQPMNFLDIVFNYKEQHNLLRLQEYNHSFIYSSIPFEIVKTAIAQFLLEVIEQCIKEVEPNQYLYLFLEQNFKDLDKLAMVNNSYNLNFLVGLMEHIGIKPDNNFNEETPYFNLLEGCFEVENLNNMHTLAYPISERWSALLQGEIELQSKAAYKELLHSVLQYFEIHVSGFRKIKSLKILELVFA